MENKTFVDLFCGAGGLTLGLVQAGWKPIVAVDYWLDALKTYSGNLNGHPVLEKDIHEVSEKDLERFCSRSPDWVVGGPPCQGFSTVGKRQRDDPRNTLVYQFHRLIEILRPANILIENVLGLRDMDYVDFIIDLFSTDGYVVTPLILCCANYGVPQLRRRVFFVGDRRGRIFRPPLPTHSPEQFVTVWDAIGDLPSLLPGQSAAKYDKEPLTEYQRRLRLGSKSLQGHKASNHPHDLVQAISFIPDGGNRRHIPDELQPGSGYHNSYSRLNSKAPAVAVTQNMGKPSGTRCIHPFQNRGLTAREGARLQGFPDAYHFYGGMISQRLQIANAVPPLLAYVLGRSLGSDECWEVGATPNSLADEASRIGLDIALGCS
ncbi:MAG: DNA cytosine methyltransferase [Syntrophobacteraceae bacterium]